jgi:hypothetical protein
MIMVIRTRTGNREHMRTAIIARPRYCGGASPIIVCLNECITPAVWSPCPHMDKGFEPEAAERIRIKDTQFETADSHVPDISHHAVAHP